MITRFAVAVMALVLSCVTAYAAPARPALQSEATVTLVQGTQAPAKPKAETAPKKADAKKPAKKADAKKPAKKKTAKAKKKPEPKKEEKKG